MFSPTMILVLNLAGTALALVALTAALLGAPPWASVLIGLAGIIFVGGAAWDIQSLPDHVEEYNKRGSSFALAPTLVPTASGEAAFGLAAMGTF